MLKPREVADYISDLTEELAGLARGAEFDVLAYLLEMAHLEADAVSRRSAATVT